jgi:hypothetical protein
MTTSDSTTPSGRDADLRRWVGRAWNELQESIGRLDERQLTVPGADGWSVKDHIAHIAVWEQYLIAVLERREPYAALGLPARGGLSTDELNAVIRDRHSAASLADVRRLSGETHAALTRVLDGLSDADVERPYASFQPGAGQPDGGRPIRLWIAGNTAEHYEEHRDWIRALQGKGGQAPFQNPLC